MLLPFHYYVNKTYSRRVNDAKTPFVPTDLFKSVNPHMRSSSEKSMPTPDVRIIDFQMEQPIVCFHYHRSVLVSSRRYYSSLLFMQDGYKKQRNNMVLALCNKSCIKPQLKRVCNRLSVLYPDKAITFVNSTSGEMLPSNTHV